MNTPNHVPGRTLAKMGAWLQLGPVFGMIGTVIGMKRAFSTLETSQSGDPAVLSGAIGEVLVSTAIGIGFATIGFVCLLVAMTLYRFRPRWAKVMLAIAAVPVLVLAATAVGQMLSPQTTASPTSERSE